MGASPKKRPAQKPGVKTVAKYAGRMPNIVVGSQVKAAVRSLGYRCSGDFVAALNEEVLSLLLDAVRRTEANNRGTVRPHDL